MTINEQKRPQINKLNKVEGKKNNDTMNLPSEGQPLEKSMSAAAAALPKAKLTSKPNRDKMDSLIKL